MATIPARTPPLEPVIARIRDARGGIQGMGFLVSERHVLTCSHVVKAALGGVPEVGRDVALDFPFVNEGGWTTSKVVICQPDDDGLDVAVLELVAEPPAGARPVRPLVARQLLDHRFISFGVPKGIPGGSWASGVFSLSQLDGWVQIEATGEYAVVPGFSGSPVWDFQNHGIVGMVVAADRRPEVKVAFMIPVRKLSEAWPDLARRTLDADSLEHLQAQLAELEQEQRNSPTPHRFQHAVKALEREIANWHGGTERQRERIREGLAREVARRLAFAGGRLPDAGERFKDRTIEQERIGSLLFQDTTRLVSVIGRGGMGKTALVSKVLHDLERYRWPRDAEQQPLDGVVCLSTRSTGISLERLFLTCAEMLGGAAEVALNKDWTNPQVMTAEKVFRLLEALRPKRYLVVLDNLEDLLDERGCIRDPDLNLFFEQNLLTGGARLLVTSRVALHFRHDVLQYDQQVRLMEGLPTGEGMALLRELDPNGWYGLKDAPEKDLQQAVTIVHGVPRALEVLASILANDPYARLAEVTRHFFTMEEVMDALIQENYKLLDARARRVVETLAVLRRPALEVAIDYVLEPFEPGLNVPDIVTRLAQTAMVAIDRQTGTVALHPIDQDYIYSQLRSAGSGEHGYTREALERRAAELYSTLRTPCETWRGLRDLEPQLTEFEHHVRAGDHDRACTVLSSIDYEYLYKWGHYRRLVDMQEQLQGHLSDPGQQAYSLGSLGLGHYQLGEVDLAIASYEKGLAIARASDDGWNESICLARLGNAHFYTGQIDRAVQDFQDALRIARGRNDARGEEWQLSTLGNAYRKVGRLEEAVELYHQALAIADRIHDRRGREFHLDNLGSAYLELGAVERAIPCFEEALQIAREIHSRRGEGLRLDSLSRTWRALGQTDRAIETAEQALTAACELGHRSDESLALTDLAWATLAAGQPARARDAAAEALRRNVPETAHQAALVLALALLRQGLPDAGMAFSAVAERARDLLARTPDLWEARYGLFLSLAGEAVCGPRWAEPGQRPALLEPALQELDRARRTSSAPGLVQRAQAALEQMRAAGVEGLDPVFARFHL